MQTDRQTDKRTDERKRKHILLPSAEVKTWASTNAYLQITGLNHKIKQQHTTFVDWCYCGREFLLEKVCLFVVYNN